MVFILNAKYEKLRDLLFKWNELYLMSFISEQGVLLSEQK